MNTLTFLGILEGFKSTTKQLHWSTPSKNLHLVCDSLHQAIDKFQDMLAENYMGTEGVTIEMGSILTTTDFSVDFNELVENIRQNVETIRNSNDPALETIIGDFLVELNKLTYLSKLQ